MSCSVLNSSGSVGQDCASLIHPGHTSVWYIITTAQQGTHLPWLPWKALITVSPESRSSFWSRSSCYSYLCKFSLKHLKDSQEKEWWWLFIIILKRQFLCSFKIFLLQCLSCNQSTLSVWLKARSKHFPKAIETLMGWGLLPLVQPPLTAKVRGRRKSWLFGAFI